MVDLIHGLHRRGRAREPRRVVHERLEQAGRKPGEVQILAAVKYLPSEELEALAAGGITLVGENRAQDLIAKAAAHPELHLGLHRRAAEPQGGDAAATRPLHPLGRDRLGAGPAGQARRRRTRASWSRSTSPATRARRGSQPTELPGFLERCPVRVVGLMTMPPLAAEPEQSRRHFAALRELAETHGLRELSMGTSQDYGVAAEEGATIIRLGSLLYRAKRRHNHRGSREFRRKPEPPTDMAFRDTWHRTLVYFGLAEDEAYDDDFEPYSEPEVQMQDSYRDRPTVRRLDTRSRRRRDEFDDIFGDDDDRHTTVLRPGFAAGPMAAATTATCACTSSRPKNFNDAQDVADKFKDTIPVILNLQGADSDLSKRLIDFASGLTYALDGGMQRIADKVFLLTPQNVEVSAEERARLIEKGFFNQVLTCRPGVLRPLARSP